MPAAPSAPKKKSILGDVVTYGFASVLARALTFFLIPLYTTYLTPADYGVLDLVNQIGAIINTVLMLNGIGLATMTFFMQAKSEEERRQVVIGISLMMGLGVLVAGAIVTPFTPLIIDWFKLPYSKWVFVLGCATVLGEVVPVVPYTLMQARIESRRFMLWHAGSLLVRLLVTILAVAVLKWGIYGILAIRAATGLITGGILIYQELKSYWIRPKRSLMRRMLNYTLPFVPVGVFSLVRSASQRFFLLAHSGLTDLGIFSLGSTLCGIVELLAITPFNKVWNAKMYAVHESPQAARTLGAVTTKFTALYLVGGLPLLLFGQEFLAVVSSDSYAGAFRVFLPLLIVGLIDAFANVPDQVFIVHHKTHYKPYIVGAVAGVAVLLYWFAVPRYGMMGAAYGLVATAGLRALAIVVISQRVFPIAYEIGKLLRLMGVSALVVYAAAMLPLTVWAFGVKVLLMLAWVACLLLLAIIPREDFQSLVDFSKSIFRTLGRKAPQN